jgi:type IV secretion system protein VirB4
MIRLDELTREYREAGALNGLFAIHSVLDERTFFTKSGQLLQFVHVAGVDHECLDHPQLERVARRFEAALRAFTGAFRIYQILCKRDGAYLPNEPPANPTVREAVTSRIEHLRAKADSLYTLDIHFAIAYDPGLGKRDLGVRLRTALGHPRQAATDWLSQSAAISILDSDLDRAILTLTQKVNSFILQLRDAVKLEAVNAEAGFQVLARVLNYTPFKTETLQLHGEQDLDYQLANSVLECHRDHLRLDNYYVRVLTRSKRRPRRRTPIYSGASKKSTAISSPSLNGSAKTIS